MAKVEGSNPFIRSSRSSSAAARRTRTPRPAVLRRRASCERGLGGRAERLRRRAPRVRGAVPARLDVRGLRCQECVRRFGLDRAREQISLTGVALLAAEDRQLFVALDALRERLDRESARELNER